MPATGGFGRSDVARCWAGFASLGAGLVHLAVVREHLAEWWLFGAFFVVVGALQVGYAVLALARDRAPAPRSVAAVNAGLIVLWAVTRAVGLPVGPERWTPEAVGVADVLCAVLEVVVVGLLVAAVRVPRHGRPLHLAAGARLALLGVGALAMAAVTTPALAATEAGEHAHPHGQHGSP
jgi:hypothetical protein